MNQTMFTNPLNHQPVNHHSGSWAKSYIMLLASLLLVACGGGGGGGDDRAAANVSNTPNTTVPALKANNYSVTTNTGTATEIFALDNDIGTHDPSLVVTIISAPANGTAVIQANNSILYTPNPGFIGTDTLRYRITLASGATDTATVTIDVNGGPVCAYSAGLAWDTTTDPNISGYYIYHGTASGNYPDKTYVGLVFSHDYCLSTTGNHYFAATSVNIYGIESSLSPELMITIP